jgi:acetolactate synthase-1/2/3 large subunit
LGGLLSAQRAAVVKMEVTPNQTLNAVPANFDTKTDMNNADLIVQILKATGIRHGFGVPSGNVLPLMNAMRTGGIGFVLTAHEGSAAFAADVTGRVTGVPGLCIATLGPGATNLATGVGSAWLDRSPLIAITCTLNEGQLGRRLQMWIDHHALFKPITKATFRLRPGEIVPIMAQALKIALSEPQGPVHLDLPEDVALASATEAAGAMPDHVPLMPAPERSIARAGELLLAAKRPLAVIGANAMRMRDPLALCAFVERMPFATTMMAKGMIDEDHPLSLGCIERAMRKLQRTLIRSADLVVGLGYDTVEVEYETWVGKVPVLHIGIERADVDASVHIAHEVVGNLDASIAHMAELPKVRNDWPARSARQHRELFQNALRPATANFAPHQAIDVVRKVLPREGVLAVDVGAHTHQIGSQWTAHAPYTFLVTNGWSSMGFGIPAALAAKLAHPALSVVCILGDGCFQMTCGEVAVARRQGLAIPFVVLNDRWLSLIKVKQERLGLPYYGAEVSPGDYPLPPAHYFGVRTVGVDSAAGLERELRKAFAADGPTIIEAAVDAAHYSQTVYD